MKKTIALLLAALLLLPGCASGAEVPETGSDTAATAPPADGYLQISQEEAMRMMELDDGHLIVDVRRQDESGAGHIPGAVLLPNESIGTEPPAELPDFDQILLIYCRRGNRSKDAAQKLANMGYTNVYEFGGINTWPGELVTD